MTKKKLSTRFFYFARDIRSREMFSWMASHCRGNVLDVGGWDFFLTAKAKGFPFDHWTCLESDETRLLDIDTPEYSLVFGDGCQMDFPDETFDTVLNIQVLEHVFEPIKMVEECARVLKTDGYAIFLIPQTSTLHLIPEHYYNFTPFWIKKAMEKSGLEIVALKPLGGIWSSEASHLFHFVFQSLMRKLKSPIGQKRSLLFYVLFPLMVMYSLVNLPITLLFSLGDLTEEANNNLVVVRKTQAI